MPVSNSVLALSTDNLTNVPRAPATKPAVAAVEAPAPEMPVVVPGVLAVPVQVWRALESRLATLEHNERDTRKYLRAHLALEHGKREQARALERKYPASALQTSVPAEAEGVDAVILWGNSRYDTNESTRIATKDQRLTISTWPTIRC